ncbi:hypothetical protein [Brassicibacter mesophilus]|uniref:hypothetical protein n=1 Tax=Brassicibacter mesophilus TaxID=745119 RepID=UPI003D201968
MTKKLVMGFSIIIILLESLFISYISYTDFINLQIITANSLMSDKSVTVLFKEGNIALPLHKLINRYPDITILSELYNYPDLRVWGICGNSFLDSRTNSFIEGTFFNKGDFFKKEFKAVVGKNVINSDNCFEDNNGKKYFVFYDNYYEVIGYISSDISNMLDNTAFVNLDSFDVKLRGFIIDSAKSSSIVTAVNSLKKEYDVDIIRENDNFIERYIFNDVDRHILNIIVTIFASILTITLLMFTLRYYSEEIKVKRIIGISFKSILYDLIRSVIFLTAVNIAFVVTIYAIIYYIFLQNIYIGFYFHSLIIFSFTILTTICLAIYVCMLISNNLFYKNGVK